MKSKWQRGISVVELILSSAIFLVFSMGTISVVLHGFNLNRLSEEQTIATQFATEGIEAARSIKNQAFTNLVNSTGTGVVRNGSNVWAFSGANNTLDAGKTYTRVIKVEGVNRDATPPSGNIILTGTPDPDAKKITSTVTWNFSPANSKSVVLVSYLTDWRKAIGVSVGDGIMVYGETTTVARPRYRLFTDSTNSFSAEAETGNSFTDTLVGKNFFVQTNPTKTEAIAGYVNNSGVLRILCFDGTTWTSEWTVTVGGTGTNDARFGIAFEKTSGDAMVVYSTNTATANEMAYRTKAGSTGCGTANWAAATNITAARTNGIVQWIRMENSPVSGSDNIALAWADNASDLSAMIWTGSSWGIAEPASFTLETELERVSASQDSLSFDIAFESLTGNLMVVWGLNQATTCTAGTIVASTNCIRYARYTTSWSTINVIPTVADPATNIDLSANPNSNELALASVDNNQADLSAAYWSGSAWTGRANLDTSAQAVTAGSKRVATGWLISGAATRWIIIYNDLSTTNIGWFVVNGSGAPALQTDIAPTPVFASPQQWYRIDTDPNDKDRLLFTLSDNGSDLFAKRLVMTATPAFTWSGADGNAALETSLGQASSRPFGFAYWRN